METPRPEINSEAKDAIYSELFDDIYFAAEDGLAESRYVFLEKNGLPERWQERHAFTIAETGFGTGLNFLAAWKLWDETTRPDQHLTYISVEKYPLSSAQIKQALLRWPGDLGDKLDKLIDCYPLRIGGWHKIRMSANVTLILIFDDVNRAWPELNTKVDAWFLDGHAPAKNPDMWTDTVFKAMAKNSRKKTSFASFTAAGIVKDGLRAVGFHVEKTRGFGRKRDMIVGYFMQGEAEVATVPTIQKIAVIGAGLAGTRAARILQDAGKNLTIYDADGIAAGASGNHRALYNPRFTTIRNEVSDFYASAYATVYGILKKSKDCDFDPCGNLHLMMDATKEKKLREACESWGWHTDHMQILSSTEASEMAGIDIDCEALILQDGGSVNPSALCRYWAKDISFIQKNINDLKQNTAGWIVDETEYDAVILACGTGLLNFQQLKFIPLQTVRGQVAYANVTEKSAALRINISYGGYCSREIGGRHILGSTFQPWLDTAEIRKDDNADILRQFETAIPVLQGELEINNAWAGLRVAANDRFPVGGAVPGFDNLYVSGAHGSHGLLSSVAVAERIAEEILGYAPSLPHSTVKLLSPQRFINRQIKKV